MKISDLKVGQNVTINGMLVEYQGIQKIKVSGFGKVEKRVFKGIGIEIFKYFSLNDGTKTLEQEGIYLA
jgi:hypothetical protein